MSTDLVGSTILIFQDVLDTIIISINRLALLKLTTNRKDLSQNL